MHLHICPDTGPLLASEQDALDLIGQTFGKDVGAVVVPSDRLDGDFFRLETGLAGAFIQKFTNYDCRLIILGDISPQMDASNALRDFVRESNRGRHIWFVDDRAALDARLND